MTKREVVCAVIGLGFVALVGQGCGPSTKDLRVEKRPSGDLIWTNVSEGPIEITEVSINNGRCVVKPFLGRTVNGTVLVSWSEKAPSDIWMNKFTPLKSVKYDMGQGDETAPIFCQQTQNPIKVEFVTTKGTVSYSFEE